MAEEIDWVLQSKLRRSTYRKRILRLLQDGPMTPSELARKTGKQISHVSRALRDLSDLRVVVCLTPKEIKGRLYALTELGKDCLESLGPSAH